jgi:hypothetical protein
MSYLKLSQTTDDPFAQPAWVHDAESATAFDTRERAEAAKVRVAGSSGVIHDDEQDCWYVARA